MENALSLRVPTSCDVAFETGLLTPQLLVKFLMTGGGALNARNNEE